MTPMRETVKDVLWFAAIAAGLVVALSLAI